MLRALFFKYNPKFGLPEHANYPFIMKYILLFLATALLVSCQEIDKRPNVIIFFSDDMRDVDISMYGRTQPTPSLQKLAEEGARFNNAYCSSGMCTPSRYTLMTGNFAGR